LHIDLVVGLDGWDHRDGGLAGVQYAGKVGVMKVGMCHGEDPYVGGRMVEGGRHRIFSSQQAVGWWPGSRRATTQQPGARHLSDMNGLHDTVWFALANLCTSKASFHDDVVFPNTSQPARLLPNDLTLSLSILPDDLWRPASEPRNLDKLVEPSLCSLPDV